MTTMYVITRADQEEHENEVFRRAYPTWRAAAAECVADANDIIGYPFDENIGPGAPRRRLTRGDLDFHRYEDQWKSGELIDSFAYTITKVAVSDGRSG